MKSCIVLRKNRSNQAKGRFLMAFSTGLKLGILDPDDVKIQDCFQILLDFTILDMEDRGSGDIFMKISSSPPSKESIVNIDWGRLI